MLDKEMREVLVKAFEETHDADEVARIFGVSRRTVYTYVEKARDGQSLEVRTSERGRKPKLTEQDKEAIGNCILEKPDITIHPSALIIQPEQRDGNTPGRLPGR